MDRILRTEDLIEKYRGRPYDFPAWDCYRLITAWYRDLGHELPDYRYAEDWAKEGENIILEKYHEWWEKVSSPKIHDVILFYLRQTVSHAGIYLGMVNGEEMFIHCSEGAGTALERMNRWRRRVYGFFRLRERR